MYSSANIGNITMDYINITLIEHVDKIYKYEVMYMSTQEENIQTPILNMGHTEVFEQLKNVLSFFFMAIFEDDEDKVAIKSKYMARVLTNSYTMGRKIDNAQHVVDKVVRKLLKLKRDEFNIFIKVITEFNNSLIDSETNINKAYSTFVYIIETLAFNFYKYTPIWEDHPKYSEFQKIFEKIDDIEIVTSIQNVLIKDSHLKLNKRYNLYVNERLNVDEFLSIMNESFDILLTFDEFSRALRNTYQMRSKYVHELQNINRKIYNYRGGSCLGLDCENDIYFTYRGLFAVTKKLIHEELSVREEIENETYDYTQDYINKYNNFIKLVDFKNLSYNNFIDNVELIFESILREYINNRKFKVKLELFIKLFCECQNASKEKINAVYYLYKVCKLLGILIENDEVVLKKISRIKNNIEYNNIYYIIYFVFGNNDKYLLDYRTTMIVIDKYCKGRYKKYRLNLPTLVESAIYIRIGQVFTENRNFWLDRALKNSVNYKELQLQILNSINTNNNIELQDFLNVYGYMDENIVKLYNNVFLTEDQVVSLMRKK